VRVEGKTQTLFGPTQPVLEGGADALDRARRRRASSPSFYYHVTHDLVRAVRRPDRPLSGRRVDGWVFKVNGVSPPVGADQVALHDGDTVLWYFATFGPTGGPKTLALRKGSRRNCYRVSRRTTPARRRPPRRRAPRRRPLRPHARRRRLRRQARRARDGDSRGAVRSNALR
jgi:hypothetical protein